MTVKILRVLGTIWVIFFAIAFTVGMVSIAVKDGIGKSLETMSPFNVVGYIVNLISISPGLFMFWLAKIIEQNRSGEIDMITVVREISKRDHVKT